MIMDRRRHEFLIYLRQPEQCELFYDFMKIEQLEHLLEFYLTCDELSTLSEQRKQPARIIELIYKHYLLLNRCHLPAELMTSIEQRLVNKEYHRRFYDDAQEFILKYMLQMCFPKFLIEQQNRSQADRSSRNVLTVHQMHRRRIVTKRPAIINSNIKTSAVQIKNRIGLFDDLKRRLLIHQTASKAVNTSGADDSSTILDRQIANTIDDADQCLIEKGSRSESIEVIWYPSLDSSKTLLSYVPIHPNPLTFGHFQSWFKPSTKVRYFFKTTCTRDINEDQYIFRELLTDDELIPICDGKIFLQLDRLE